MVFGGVVLEPRVGCIVGLCVLFFHAVLFSICVEFVFVCFVRVEISLLYFVMHVHHLFGDLCRRVNAHLICSMSVHHDICEFL